GDVVRLVLAVQRAAKPGARELDDVEAGLLERNTDHLGVFFPLRARERERRRAFVRGDGGELAFADVALERLLRLLLVRAPHEVAMAADDRRLVFVHANGAAGNRLAGAELELLPGELRFDI